MNECFQKAWESRWSRLGPMTLSILLLLQPGVKAQDSGPTVGNLVQAAFEGDVIAQLSVATMYEERRAYEDAAKWFKRAALQGNPDAQFKIGFFLSTGQGGTTNLVEAADWYERAASNKVARAQHNLAVCLEHGLGRDKDLIQALKWYREAAYQRDTFAQKAVGVFHHQGKGVSKDLAEAGAWYMLAAGRGNVRASQLLEELKKEVSVADWEKAKETGNRLSVAIYSEPLRDPVKTPEEEKKEMPKDFLE